jgi:hypothetical protein
MSDLSISLREYVDTLLREREKELYRTAAELERRLEGLNDLRAEVVKDRNMYLLREVYERMHGSLVDRIGKLENMQTKIVTAGLVLVTLSGLLGWMFGRIIGKP